MKPVALKDFLQYRFLSGLRYAPDGRRAAFVVTTAHEAENSYESRLWLYDGGLRQLTDLGRERNFRWENENCLLFASDRSESDQKRRKAGESFTSFYRLDLRGGEAVHAFTLPFAAGRMERIPNGWAVLGSIDAAFPDEYAMDTAEREQLKKHRAEEADYEVLDELPFWGNGAGMVNKKRTALFLTDGAGEVRRISEPLETVDDLVCAGQELYYISRTYGIKAPRVGAEIWKVRLSSWEKELVASVPDLAISAMAVVEGQLWLTGSDRKVHGLNQGDWVFRLVPETGVLEPLRQEEYSMYSAVGSDCRYGGGEGWQVKGGRLYHTTTRGGSSHLYVLSDDGESRPVIEKEGSIDCVALAEQGDTALLVAMYDGKLQELYEADLATGAVRQVSRFNETALADKYVAAYEPVAVESCGLTIDGWVLKPRGYDPSGTYPAILDIHGGPKTVYGPVFYHEMQVWASMGYFVFFCNPKGSDGRGNDFAEIRGHYGEEEYTNLMDFTDCVLERYPQIDRRRVCVTGGSYGGFMTNWIIGHTDRFCCAASQRSISNMISFYGVSDTGVIFVTDQCQGDPWNDLEKVWRQSPLKYAPQAKTPTLFIHADEDYRCPLEQALQMYTALQERGVPTRLCMFHGENHELSRSGKPRHRVRRLEEITGWFETYAR